MDHYLDTKPLRVSWRPDKGENEVRPNERFPSGILFENDLIRYRLTGTFPSGQTSASSTS